jgi:hypothetical protein
VSRFKSRVVAVAFGAVLRTARTGAAMSQEDLALKQTLIAPIPACLNGG